MTSKSVYIVGGGNAYSQMFDMYGWKISNDLESADLIQFTGGEDVTPAVYGSRPHRTTHNNLNRDLIESRHFYRGFILDKPMAGICRGGQFLNVMCGGSLYQHVDNHAIAGTHEVTTHRGKVLQVTSTHHQMMIPSEKGHVLATTRLANKREWVNEIGQVFENDCNSDEDDTEVVWYPSSRVLCFQPHPEQVAYNSRVKECADYYFECLNLILED